MPEAPAAAPPRRPATPRVRALLALAAGIAGWLFGCAVAIGFDGLLVEGSTSWDGMLFFLGMVGLFAAGGWVVSVLPLALFADHRSFIFHPAAAPVVGAACGVALLLVELWLFFGDAPSTYIGADMTFSDVYLLVLAAMVGAAIWSGYVLAVRAWGRRAGGGPA